MIKTSIPSFSAGISDYFVDLKMINSALVISSLEHRFTRHLLYDVIVEFFFGVYNQTLVLIRTYKSQDPMKLLPYVEEAKLLKRLNGEHTTFIKYYGSMHSYKDCCEFSILTEWCSKSLMTEITERSYNQLNYSEDKLIKYTTTLIEGLIVLKKHGVYHRNIKPHNIVLNSESEIKITGFMIPETEI